MNGERDGIRGLFHKSLVTTIIAAGMVVAGLFISEPIKGPILSIGLFALSGAGEASEVTYHVRVQPFLKHRQHPNT